VVFWDHGALSAKLIENVQLNRRGVAKMLFIFIMHQYICGLTTLHQCVGAENVMVQHLGTFPVAPRILVQHMVKNVVF
jgi:hypothetical protein